MRRGPVGPRVCPGLSLPPGSVSRARLLPGGCPAGKRGSGKTGQGGRDAPAVVCVRRTGTQRHREPALGPPPSRVRRGPALAVCSAVFKRGAERSPTDAGAGERFLPGVATPARWPVPPAGCAPRAWPAAGLAGETGPSGLPWQGGCRSGRTRSVVPLGGSHGVDTLRTKKGRQFKHLPARDQFRLPPTLCPGARYGCQQRERAESTGSRGWGGGGVRSWGAGVGGTQLSRP